MTVLAVKDFVANQIDARVGTPTGLSVHRQRPKQDTVASYQAVIVIACEKSHEARLTVNRPFGGQKTVLHRVQALVYYRHDDAEEGGDLFDVLKAKIDGVIRTAEMPVDLRDPMTGDESRILFIGEEIDTQEFAPVQDEGVDNSVVFSCTKSFPVTELING